MAEFHIRSLWKNCQNVRKLIPIVKKLPIFHLNQEGNCQINTSSAQYIDIFYTNLS